MILIHNNLKSGSTRNENVFNKSKDVNGHWF